MQETDLLSLLVSVIAVTISAVALIRSRKLAEKQIELEQQQADLAKKQLEQIHAQEEYAKLAPKQPATFVLWNADPLEPLAHAERLWIDGKEISLDNRQMMLARKYLKQ